MKHHINNWIALVSVALILTGSFLVYENSENSLTGFSVYDPDEPMCHENILACPDLNGDGSVSSGSEDEKIFSCLIDPTGISCPDTLNQSWNETFGNTYEHFRDLADFDGSGGDISQLLDFQRCYVPMRDAAIDDGTADNITCNKPKDEFNDDICQFGCPDLNGDGYVDDNDLTILTSDSVWMNDTFYERYPMADMNNDDKIDWLDKSCMTLYANEYALCNMPRHFKHENYYTCPDLENISTDLDNDGFVNDYDQVLFDKYYEDDNLIVDYSGDGAINWEDKWIFDIYRSYQDNVVNDSEVDKTVICNLYHAAWHTGGVDQVGQAYFTGTGNLSTNVSWHVGNGASDLNIIGAEYGWLTKIRLNMTCPTTNTQKVNVTLKEGTDILAKTTIPAFKGTKWVTAYFSTTPYLNPRLKNDTTYSALLEGNSNCKLENSTPNIETYMTTAHADLNGDGIVDEKDQEIILDMPDGLWFNGTSNWTSSYDLNNDSIINDLDFQIFTNAVGNLTPLQTLTSGNYEQTGTTGKGIIPNGDFNEINDSGGGYGYPHKWYDNNGNLTNSSTSLYCNNSIKSLDLRVKNDSIPYAGARSKKLLLKPGTTYNVTASIKIQNFSEPMTGTWEIHTQAHDGSCSGTKGCHHYVDESVNGNYTWDNTTTNMTWLTKWKTFKTESDVKVGYVYIVTNESGGTGGLYVDHVTIEEIPSYEWFGGSTKLTQKFEATTETPIKIVSLKLAMDKGNDEDITVKILNETGNSIGSTTIPALHNSTPAWYNATFDDSIQLTQDLDYYIEVSASSGDPTDYRWYAKYD